MEQGDEGEESGRQGEEKRWGSIKQEGKGGGIRGVKNGRREGK